MKSSALLLVVVFAAMPLLVACSAGPQGQDMVKIAPQNCTVLIENDRVRVVRVVLRPGESIGMHNHPNGDIWMPKGPAKVRTIEQGGRSEENEVDPTRVYWSDAGTHSIENIGTTEYQSVVVELKR